MKKISKIILIVLSIFCLMPAVKAKEKLNLYLFWGDGCPHCEKEQEYLKEIEEEFPNVNIIKYEVWYNEDNNALMKQIAQKTNKSLSGVPVTIIGQTIITGFSEGTKQQLRRAISYYSQHQHSDIVDQIKNGTYNQTTSTTDQDFQKEEIKQNKKTTISLPILKKVNFQKMELTTAIPILGILASLSWPFLWLMIIFSILIMFHPQKKEKTILLLLGIPIMMVASIIFTISKLDSINWIMRILLLLICLLTIIIQLQKIKIPQKIVMILTIMTAIIIATTTSHVYWEILTELLQTAGLPNVMNFLYQGYYIMASFFSCAFVIFLIYIVTKKIPQKFHQTIQLSLLTITMLFVIFL